jgi:hypothetical protein
VRKNNNLKICEGGEASEKLLDKYNVEQTDSNRGFQVSNGTGAALAVDVCQACPHEALSLVD